MTGPIRHPDLPPISPLAWHGPIGESVLRTAPCTEAEPAGMLVNLLAIFGAMCGTWAYMFVGGREHPARIWPLVVGPSGDGRKGTGYTEASRIATGWGELPRKYMATRVLSGVGSGEALIEALGGGADTDKQPEGPDAEVVAPDGRMLLREDEFVRILAVARRDGSTLGVVLRQLWDHGDAAVITRSAPVRVTGAHLTVCVDVVPHELKLKMSEADLVGGTINRFLLCQVRQAQILPHPPPYPRLPDQNQRIADALEHARAGRREVRRDEAADALWSDVYHALCTNLPDGLLGSVLVRGPIQTMRLALIYALADGRAAISPRHLLAGLAVWQYATATARRLWEDPSGHSAKSAVARYLAAAGEFGRTGTEISRRFRHCTADQLQRITDELADRALILRDREDTKGRPVTRYWWIGGEIDPVAALLRQHEATLLPPDQEA